MICRHIGWQKIRATWQQHKICPFISSKTVHMGIYHRKHHINLTEQSVLVSSHHQKVERQSSNHGQMPLPLWFFSSSLLGKLLDCAVYMSWCTYVALSPKSHFHRWNGLVPHWGLLPLPTLVGRMRQLPDQKASCHHLSNENGQARSELPYDDLLYSQGYNICSAFNQ